MDCCLQGILQGQLAVLDFLLVEYHLIDDVRRPFVPMRVIAIELDCGNRPRTDIRTPSPKSGWSEKFESKEEVRMPHSASDVATVAPRLGCQDVFLPKSIKLWFRP